MDEQARKVIRISVIGVVVVLVGLLFLEIGKDFYNKRFGIIETIVVPYDATVIIDDKKMRPNKKLYVDPGSYKVTVERKGFGSDTQTVTIKKQETKTLEFFLPPQSEEAQKWLDDHPEAALSYESYTGRQFQESVNRVTRLEPLVQELPYLGPGLEYRIDYGTPLPGSDHPDEPTIYIDAKTEQAKQDALAWIREQGFDPSTMNISYVGASENETAHDYD